jgi:glycosyltransferase involved in cell wall biosynthesis
MNKILILSDWYCPGYKAGGPIRSLNNLVNALEELIIIHIITSDTDLNSTQPYKNIEPGKWLSIGNTKIIYLSKSDKTISRMKKLILEVNPDIIYLNSMYSLYFTLFPLIALYFLKINKYKIILATRGMLQQGAIQSKNKKKKIFIFFFKLFAIEKKILFHATDEQEKKDITGYFPLYKDIKVIGNFVSLPKMAERKIIKESGSLSLVYISVISSKKNLLYLPAVFNSINGKIIFDVYGVVKDKKYWELFLEKIKNVQNVQFNYYGDIPNHLVKTTLLNYDFFILPTLGENFGHAIYEALSAGLPVIISDKTPWRNLENQKAGWGIALDSTQKFIDTLNYCAVMNNEEYKNWSIGAFNYANNYYKENNPADDYLKMFSK